MPILTILVLLKLKNDLEGNQMAEFNPDEYLAQKPTQQDFDPDAYLGQKTTVAKTQQQVAPTIPRQALNAVVEALGGIAGGALGAPLGPLGIVGGAGLGYGIGKEAMQNLDVLMGVKPPRQGMMQVSEPLQNILEGATYEAGGRVAVPLIAKGAGKLMDIVSPAMSAAQSKASQIAREALGKDLPAVLDVLKNTKPGASIAEVTASLQNPTWQALIQNALERDPQFLRKINLFGEEESLKALSKLAGGGNAAETRQILENAKTALTTTTTPMREAALSRANLGKAVADYEATAGKLSNEAAIEVQKVRDLIKAGNLAEASARLDLIKRGLPVGFAKFTYKDELAQKAFNEWADKAAQASLDLGQGARFAKAAADSLRSYGIKPLNGAKLANDISKISQNPSFAGDDVLIGAVNNVADDIAKWTNKDTGIIDAQALEAIRKHSVNAVINKLRPGMDATAQRNLEAKVLSDIKPLIDDAIEQSGGVGWKKYLQEYSQGMQKIAERKLSAEGLRLWKTNKDEFVKLVMNESPDAVEKILGPGRYNIALELANNDLAILNQQAQKRLTQLSVAEQASEGQKALSELVKQQTSVIRLPSFLSFWTSAGNKAISEFEKAVGKNTMDILTQAMKSPEGASNLLQSLPAVERNKVLNLLVNPAQWSSKAGLTGTAGLREVTKATPEITENVINFFNSFEDKTDK